MTGLTPIVLTEKLVAKAFWGAGFGEVTFPEPIKRHGNGTLVIVELPAGTPTFRFHARHNLVIDALELTRDAVFVEPSEGNSQQWEIWVHDGDAAEALDEDV